MGKIKNDVLNTHLVDYPWELELLKPFLHGFDITWGRRRTAHNTDLSVYFLRPEAPITDLFGFEHEIALFLHGYPTLEARTMQSADQIMTEDPAQGRVDQSLFFLISAHPQVRTWVSDYIGRNPQARLPVVFAETDLRGASRDHWFTRNAIRSQLFSRDLFNSQLPVESDLFFFGREHIVADQFDAIRQSQNRGLFGLRKTGKTSILYKVQRQVEREKTGAFLYYDCKLPSIRTLRWQEFLTKITADIAKHFKRNSPPDAQTGASSVDGLLALLESIPDGKTVALVFDEIEYISPRALLDEHWHADFVPFWQTLWSAQSQIRKLSTTVVGVNPYVVEIDTVGGVQNPMFGIVRSSYLQGFTPDEVHAMVTALGKRMGISFEEQALAYLVGHYGGHPLLTRMACSFTNSSLEREQRSRPAMVTVADLVKDEDARESELVFYCRHVVSELQQFYPDEYEVLEMLASKQVSDVMELLPSSELSQHLRGYGLIRQDSAGRPVFAIPVLGRYIASEVARREGRQLFRRIVPEPERAHWLHRRVETIRREMKELSKLISDKNGPKIYGRDGYREPERFAAVGVASTEGQFESFINVCNRSFVEAVEQVGQSLRKKDYFWKDVKSAYPDLWEALQRIKLYRHNQLHLELVPKVESDLRDLLNRDLDGKRMSQVDEVWFVLQQCVLDGLFLGLQCEINRLS